MDERNNELLSRLLLDINKTQTDIIRNLKNMVFVIVISFSVMFSAFIIGFFWYEGQFDKTSTQIEQQAEIKTGDAIINNEGTFTYGD